jgi:hypothetical protein
MTLPWGKAISRAEIVRNETIPSLDNRLVKGRDDLAWRARSSPGPKRVAPLHHRNIDSAVKASGAPRSQEGGASSA